MNYYYSKNIICLYIWVKKIEKKRNLKGMLFIRPLSRKKGRIYDSNKSESTHNSKKSEKKYNSLRRKHGLLVQLSLKKFNNELKNNEQKRPSSKD